MNWPFKTIKQQSSWPLQPLVVRFAAAVLRTPPEARIEAAVKMIERCVRMGARIAVEFGMDAEGFVSIAAEQIARETGAALASPYAGDTPQA